MTTCAIERFSLEPRPSYPLHILATRYTENTTVDNEDGYTLILMHAIGMHKETWEVTIKRLFSIDRHNALIRDVFSIESPNHGESAILNEVAIQQHFGDNWPPIEYARAAHIFLTAGTSAGAKVDFSRRKLVAVGHSVGAAAVFLLRDLLPRVKFHSIIALEPGISIKDSPEALTLYSSLTAWAWLRRDVWPSREAAKKELTKSPMFNSWDPRVLELYLRYGLRRHPAAKYPRPFSFAGITTALTKTQEAASYRSEQPVIEALAAYAAFSQEIPVHLVWGEIHDMGAPELKTRLSDHDAGRRPASVSYVDKAGHMVVQQQPDAVAKVLHSLLSAPQAHL